MKKLHKDFLHVRKPWGSFSQYCKEKKVTVKILEVKAGESLSLQYHKLRDELWLPLDSGFVAEVDERIIHARIGEPIFVPRKSRHRLSAKKKARVLEIAFGKFDEKDIVRLEDKYGRKGTTKR